MKKIAVIGGGWYGCHISLTLAKKGYAVTLYEKNNQILNELSGNFGVRLHLGLHYPRSKKTREGCLDGYENFMRHYPELVNHHEHSVYGLGYRDADGKPSKVNASSFESLAVEHDSYKIMDPDTYGYRNLETAIDSTEASVVVGKKLREAFVEYFTATHVKLELNTKINQIEYYSDSEVKLHTDKKESRIFDNVINATSFQEFIPKENLFDMEVAYQICVGLIYEDTQQQEKGKPIPVIVMDGWYPCLMYYNDGENKQENKWLLYHGKWCILKTFSSALEARKQLYEELSDSNLEAHVEKSARMHLTEFYPEFSERFKYVGWKGNVIAKVRTEKEFRGAFTFQDQNTQIIHVFPGKISNVFDVENEVSKLIESKINDELIIKEGNYSFIKDGVLDRARGEISEKPKDLSRNTCSLQKASGQSKPEPKPRAESDLEAGKYAENLIHHSSIFELGSDAIPPAFVERSVTNSRPPVVTEEPSNEACVIS